MRRRSRASSKPAKARRRKAKTLKRKIGTVRFRVFALRRRALGSLLLALERRRIAHPKAQDYADFKGGLQQGFATGEMGFSNHFAQQQFSKAHVCFGSIADILGDLRDVCFTPESGHR